MHRTAGHASCYSESPDSPCSIYSILILHKLTDLDGLFTDKYLDHPSPPVVMSEEEGVSSIFVKLEMN